MPLRIRQQLGKVRCSPEGIMSVSAIPSQSPFPPGANFVRKLAAVPYSYGCLTVMLGPKLLYLAVNRA